MLAYLRIRGLALLDDVTLELSPGMTVLTGETGAGKSIIVGALSLLRGARARADSVRAGEDSAVVDARFDPGPRAWARLSALAAELGIELGDIADGLIVRRTIAKSGRSRSFLQDAPTTQAVLGRVGELLVDICSQHEHHFLTHASHHLEVLDAYADCEAMLEGYRVAYADWRAAVADLSRMSESNVDRVQREDYLRFLVEELERVAPQPGEHEALQRKHVLLRDVRQWAEFADSVQYQLYESDDALAGRLATMASRAAAGAEHCPALADAAEHLTAAQLSCEEAVRAVSRLGESLEDDPGELDAIEERLHQLQALRRKHGVDADALAQRLADMKLELDQLEHADQHQRQAAAREVTTRQACCRLAASLHDRRAAAAEGLGDAVVAELSALHLAGARLTVAVTAEAPDAPGPSGIDRVEFQFSANPGEPLAPLSRVASGGELSRVLLAIKGALAAGDRVATYVFDEVDAGVGGRVAEAIGRRLAAAAGGHQVLCVTHLPQIASFATSHLRVEKTTRGGRTTTKVIALSGAERASELARMLGGAKASATQHAERLLADAQRGARARAKATAVARDAAAGGAKRAAKTPPKKPSKATSSRAPKAASNKSPVARTKTATTKTAATKTATTKTAATKPAATKPATTKTAATKPAATKPAATKPAATKPAATKTAATKTAATKPAATKTAKTTAAKPETKTVGTKPARNAAAKTTKARGRRATARAAGAPKPRVRA